MMKKKTVVRIIVLGKILVVAYKYLTFYGIFNYHVIKNN